MNSANEEWGEERFIECVRRLVDEPAKEVISCLMAAADAFAGGAVQHDDMTLIVAKVS
jgi:serine phosphatase RsbU (regulator of sigma subunit)